MVFSLGSRRISECYRTVGRRWVADLDRTDEDFYQQKIFCRIGSGATGRLKRKCSVIPARSLVLRIRFRDGRLIAFGHGAGISSTIVPGAVGVGLLTGCTRSGLAGRQRGARYLFSMLLTSRPVLLSWPFASWLPHMLRCRRLFTRELLLQQAEISKGPALECQRPCHMLRQRPTASTNRPP